MITPYSKALIALLKGIVYESHRDIWENVCRYESDTRKYFSALGLELYIDRSEGYAFLKQIEFEPEAEAPRLIEKRQLSFLLTLLCLQLRKYLLQNDAAGTSSRAILTRDQIIQMMLPFLSDSHNEAKQVEKIDLQIRKVVEEGFLRPLENNPDTFEIRRIIKAFIDAERVEGLLFKLKEYSLQQKQHDQVN
jgi:hypothetical protein